MFPESERLIFEYAVAGVKRFADPLAVRRALLRASLGEFDQIDRESRDRPPAPDGAGGWVEQGPEDAGAVLAREDAREKLHRVVCAAFGLPPFDPDSGAGATEAESSALLDRFMDFMAGKGKTPGNSPATSESTGTPPAGGPPTPSTSG